MFSFRTNQDSGVAACILHSSTLSSKYSHSNNSKPQKTLVHKPVADVTVGFHYLT